MTFVNIDLLVFLEETFVQDVYRSPKTWLNKHPLYTMEIHDEMHGVTNMGIRPYRYGGFPQQPLVFLLKMISTWGVKWGVSTI